MSLPNDCFLTTKSNLLMLLNFNLVSKVIVLASKQTRLVIWARPCKITDHASEIKCLNVLGLVNYISDLSVRPNGCDQIYASVNSSSAHPPPPGQQWGIFPHFPSRGSGISLPSNYPGAFDHPTFFHLTTLPFLLMTISSANTVSFFLNTSRYNIRPS